MSNKAEITAAIGSHGQWKQRLKDAIASGKSDITPAQAAADNTCAFGKWLHGVSGADAHSPFYVKVRPLHATFHQEAAKVLRSALAGSKAEATHAIEDKSPFANASSALTMAMMEWSKSLG